MFLEGPWDIYPWKLASNGELDDLIKIINNGAPCDEKDDRGFTPITWAARNGHAHVLTYLMELNCSLSSPSFGGTNFSNSIYLLIRTRSFTSSSCL